MKPLGHKNAATEGEICRGREQNYFQGLEIYFRALEIYFKALEIYFRATEKVLFRAAKDFASDGSGFCIEQRRILHRAAADFASCGGGFCIGQRRLLHRAAKYFVSGGEEFCIGRFGTMLQAGRVPASCSGGASPRPEERSSRAVERDIIR